MTARTETAPTPAALRLYVWAVRPSYWHIRAKIGAESVASFGPLTTRDGALRMVDWLANQCGWRGRDYSVIHAPPPDADATDSRALALLAEAVDRWPAFDTDAPVDGGDLVEWFAEWRARARVLIEASGQ